MKTLYLYVIDTMADWEIAHLLPELCSRRYFKKDAVDVHIEYVGSGTEEVLTMGGLRIKPTIKIENVPISPNTTLILPGAETWNQEKNKKAIKLAGDLLECGGKVAAICGATVALASEKLLDNIEHTSNGPGFLEAFCPNYKGSSLYIDKPAIKAGNLVTAGATGSLAWSKYILEDLDVMSEAALDAWYSYFSTGSPQSFFQLLEEAQQ